MILAYSVALPGDVRPPQGLQVLITQALRCFYREQAEMPGALDAEVRAFFQANQSLFAQTDIIEFRYPTVLRELRELEEFLGRHEDAIVSDLQRLKGLAQLAVYLPKEQDYVTGEKPKSGTQYLHAKRDRSRAHVDAIDKVREVARGELRDSVVQGDRVLLLVSRQVAPSLAEKIIAETKLEAVGPFPPSGFAKLLS